jgi:hypothetical protein
LDRFLDVIIFIVLVLPSFLFITGATPAPLAILIVLLFLSGLSLLIRWKRGHLLISLKSYRIGSSAFSQGCLC